MRSLSIVVSGRRSRSQRGASEVAQFIPALYVVFVVMLVPLLNLAFLFLSAATLYLATNDFVARASSQQTFDILPYGRTSGAISGDPHFIPSGVSLLNFPINYAGPISLACNDCQLNDVGSQEVRIIITR